MNARVWGVFSCWGSGRVEASISSRFGCSTGITELLSIFCSMATPSFTRWWRRTLSKRVSPSHTWSTLHYCRGPSTGIPLGSDRCEDVWMEVPRGAHQRPLAPCLGIHATDYTSPRTSPYPAHTQVLANLLANSIKFTEVGEVVVQVRSEVCMSNLLLNHPTGIRASQSASAHRTAFIPYASRLPSRGTTRHLPGSWQLTSARLAVATGAPSGVKVRQVNNRFRVINRQPGMQAQAANLEEGGHVASARARPHRPASATWRSAACAAQAARRSALERNGATTRAG